MNFLRAGAVAGSLVVGHFWWVAVSTAFAGAAAAGGRSKLYFVRDGVVIRADLDGSAPEKLFPGDSPSPSPDGRFIAYHSRRHEAVLFRQDTKKHVVLRAHPSFGPQFSPDSKRVAFQVATAIVLDDLEGGGQAFFAQGDAYAWHPDSHSIWYHDLQTLRRKDLEGNERFSASLDSLFPKNVSIDGSSRFVPSPTKPDRLVVNATIQDLYVKGEGLPAGALFIWDTTSGSPRLLTPENLAGRDPCWDADGSSVFFTGQPIEGGPTSVYRIGSDGVGLQQVVHNAAQPAIFAGAPSAPAVSRPSWYGLGGAAQITRSADYVRSAALVLDRGDWPVVAWMETSKETRPAPTRGPGHLLDVILRRSVRVMRWTGKAWRELPRAGEWSELGAIHGPYAGMNESYGLALELLNDKPIVAWVAAGPDGPVLDEEEGEGGRLSIRRWTGKTWEEIPAPQPLARAPLLAVDPQGGIVLATGEEDGIRVRRWEGGRWTTFGDGAGGEEFDLALDAGGHPGVAFTEPRASGAWRSVHIRRWNGKSWEELAAPVLPSGEEPYHPQLAFEPSGGVVASWTQFREHREDTGFVALLTSVEVRRWNGTAWSSLGNPSRSPSKDYRNFQFRPVLVLDGRGLPLVAWEHLALEWHVQDELPWSESGPLPQNGAIQFARWTGEQWSGLSGSDTDLGASRTRAWPMESRLAVGKERLCLLWRERSKTSREMKPSEVQLSLQCNATE